MQIKINGKSQELPAPMTVLALAEHLQLNLKQAAVERNLEIVPKSLYPETMVADGDEIEIVQFIGGG